MSLRIDVADLIPGALVIGGVGLGVLGSEVPSTGQHGAALAYRSLDLPADASKEIRAQVLTPPAVGSLFVYEDTSAQLTGVADGAYSITFRLWVDGADLGTVTSPITVGSVSAVPVAFGGTIAPQSGTVGTAMSLSVAGRFSGSLTPFSYSLASGALPPGLALNASTGTISGTPTTAGSYSATVRATDSGGNTATSSSITWSVASLAVPVAFGGTIAAQAGTAGALSASLALAPYFSGSLTPFSYSVSSGALPPGLSLDAATGTISGTPTAAGSFSASVAARDTAGNSASTPSISWAIAAAPAGDVWATVAALQAQVQTLENRLNAVIAAGVLVYENGRWKVYN